MGFNPKDAIESAKEIATNAIEKSGEIVESAAQAVKGDLAGGVSGMIDGAKDIATTSVDKAKEILTGKDDAAE
jgi:hypothetical protein